MADIVKLIAETVGRAFSIPMKPIVLRNKAPASIDPAELLSRITGLINPAEAAYKDLHAGKSPVTPEEAEAGATTFEAAANVAYAGIQTALLAAEILTVGQVDMTLMSYFQTPILRSWMQTASNIATARDEAAVLTPIRYLYNSRFTPMIPPAVDTIRMVVREVIEPEEFYQVMGYLGFSRKWGQAYWDAHWRDIAEGRIHEAYHRNLISRDERDKFLVLLDYRPDPRPGISVSDVAIVRGLAKTLIPRVDLRYAWEMGLLTDDELVERYGGLGYEEDSELMADTQKSRALVEEIHKIRDEWIRDYIEGFTDEATLRANLEAVGIGPVRVDYYCQYARKRSEREHAKDLLDYFEDAYQKDLITEEQFTAYVNAIIVNTESAALFTDKAWVRKYKAPKAVTPKEAPKLPLGTLRMAFRLEVISEEDLREEMRRRMYSAEDIERIVSLEKERMAA